MSLLARHGLMMHSVSGDVDPHWANVVSLNHFDGSDGAVSFADERGLSWTRTGSDAFLSAVDARFGPTSLRVGGLNSDFSVPSGLIPTAALFSIEMWTNIDSLAGPFSTSHALLSQAGGGGNSDQVLRYVNGIMNFYRGSGAGDPVNISGTTVVTPGTWNFVELAYDGTTIYLFLNGTLEATASSTSGWRQSNQVIRLGRSFVPGYEQWRLGMNGYIDDARITVGAVRNTSGYAPPAQPFPNM